MLESVREIYYMSNQSYRIGKILYVETIQMIICIKVKNDMAKDDVIIIYNLI